MATAKTRHPVSMSETPTMVPREQASAGVFGRVLSGIDRLPHLTLADRFQREVLGVLLFFVAGLSGWALARGEQDGRVVAWWRETLEAAYGSVGGWLVPVFLALAALRVFRDLDESILRPRHYIGGFAFAVAALGLLDLGGCHIGNHPGGNLGIGVAMVARDSLGEVAGAVALYLIGTLSVFLLADMALSRFAGEVRRLAPRRAPGAASDVDADFTRWPVRTPDHDDLIGMGPALNGHAGDTTVVAAGRPAGRFQRRRQAFADLISGGHQGPIRAVGDVDTDLAVLSTPEPSRSERRMPAAPEAPVAPVISVPIRSPQRPSPPRATAPDDDPSRFLRDLWPTDATRPGDTPLVPPVPAVPVTPTVPSGADLLGDDELDTDELNDDDEVFGPAPEDACDRDDDLVVSEAPAVSGHRGSTRRAPAASAAAPEEPVIHVPARQAPSRRVTKETVSAQRDQAAIAPPTTRRSARGEPMPLPKLDHLPYYEAHKPNTADLEAKARVIQEKLASFRVQAWVREINTGPAVTQFALEPGEGVKVRRITELQNDLALALAAPQIRIEAPVPGMARVGIEVPNDQIMTVGLRETLESPAFRKGKQKLPIPLGLDVNGRYIVHDLTRMPHLLIAGATGSGKSVCINGIISTFLLTRRPDEVKLLMIDPKMVELTGYNGVPHLQCPVVTEMGKVVPVLRLVLREMERRYTLFSTLGVRNLDGYRLKTADEPAAEKLPYLVVIIDELADLMMTTPVEVESLLQRLTQMARATGIHMIIATQRPSVDVLTGIIKANVPARIAFMVSSGTDSRVILDVPGAERLLGKGDMLFLPPDAAKAQRIQGVFVADEDVPRLVDHWQSVVPVPQYAQEWINLPSVTDDGGGGGADGDDEDPLWDQAIEIVRKQGTASASMLQRRLRVGYNRAARMIQRMEDEEIIGPADGIKGRTVLLPADEE